MLINNVGGGPTANHTEYDPVQSQNNNNNLFFEQQQQQEEEVQQEQAPPKSSTTSVVQENGMNYDDVSQFNLADQSEYAPTNNTYNVINVNDKSETRQDMEPGGENQEQI